MKVYTLSFVMLGSVLASPSPWRHLNWELTVSSELLLTLLSSKQRLSNSPLSLVLKATDTTAAASTDTYLASPLKYIKDEHGQEICLLKINEEEEVGVMMGWERGISES